MMMAPTDEEAIDARTTRGAVLRLRAGCHGQVDYGRHNIHRTFTSARCEGLSRRASTAAAGAEPEDETRTRCSAPASAAFIGGPDYVRENLRLYEESHLDLLSSRSAATASTSTSWNRWSCSRSRSCRSSRTPRAAPEVARAAARRHQVPRQ